MNNEEFKPNYQHFTDIVSLSVGRVLENEREKGSTYSYGTFCTNIEHQINNHFGIEPEVYFQNNEEGNNCKYFSEEVTNLLENLKEKDKKEVTTNDYKEIYEEIISLMNKYHIEIINNEDYWDRWPVNNTNYSNHK